MIRLTGHEFAPAATFECGQCFRWTRSDDAYVGIAGGRVCRIRDGILSCPEADNAFWTDYFCLDMDYEAMKADLLARDPSLAPCVAYGEGLRILRQELWETIASFIISANNNIPRIRGIIESLCRSFGEPVEFEGRQYHAFPAPERLAGLEREELAPLRAGYRDKYLLDAARRLASGEICAGALEQLPTAEARKTLMQMKGVGGKVADCILLFALRRYEVFPQDVWIKRVMREVYQVPEREAAGFAASTYGGFGGFAQQYLFYYYRDHAGE